MTALGEVAIEVNADVAARLGLPAAPEQRWVLRAAD
jgi:hypothetical protein